MKESFEEKIKNSLLSQGIVFSKNLILGVAVSGGADSVSLLTALHSLSKTEPFLLKALTVDHNMRPAEQSGRDADFVESYCRSLDIPCRRFNIPQGEIFSYAKKMKTGEESAARHFRYQCFEKFISDENISYLCLAHNKNDQTETLLMRFLQGADVKALSGIPFRRGKYLRPMLEISRKEIESYLSEKNISHVNDESNSSHVFLRNRIRLELIPLLQKILPGFENSLMLVKNKMQDDSDFIEECLEKAKEKVCIKNKNGSISFSLKEYLSLAPSMRKRILFYVSDHALNGKNEGLRIPYSFISELDRKIISSSTVTFEGFGLLFSWNEVSVNVKNKSQNKTATESVFFAIVDKDGDLDFPEFSLHTEKNNSYMKITSSSGNGIILDGLDYPFVIRSMQSADTVRDAEGTFRSLSKILDGWKCGGDKLRIPIIVDLSDPACPVKAIWGDLFDYKNWIVKNNSL